MDAFRIPLARPFTGPEELAAVEEVLRSGFLTEGPVAGRLEQAVAEATGAAHAIVTTSCTTALELALRVSGIGPGDEVLVPSFTYPITVEVIRWVGATPIMVDVSLDDANIDWDLLDAAIGPNVKGIMPVSLFGHPLDPRRLQEFRDRGLLVIEDAACSLGASHGTVPTGTMADMTAFSLHPRKIVTSGEGGVLCTDDADLARKARQIKRFGITPGHEGGDAFQVPGTNWKLSDVLAAIGEVQMGRLPELVAGRRALAAAYDRMLNGESSVQLPRFHPDALPTYQSYVVRMPTPAARAECLHELRSDGIEVQVGSFATHLAPVFKDVQHAGPLDNSARLDAELLALPLHPYLSEPEQEEVVARVLEVARRHC